MFSSQTFCDELQEQSRLGALNDAVVVGRGEGHDFTNAELGESARISSFESRGPIERTHAKNCPLTRHESRYRLNGSQRAWIGERHGCSHEVVGTKSVRVDLSNQCLVREEELSEVKRVGVTNYRHQQSVRAIRLLDVDRETETDVFVMTHTGRALLVNGFHERGVHRFDLPEAFHDGVGNEMRKGHLGAARARQRFV